MVRIFRRLSGLQDINRTILLTQTKDMLAEFRKIVDYRNRKAETILSLWNGYEELWRGTNDIVVLELGAQFSRFHRLRVEQLGNMTAHNVDLDVVTNLCKQYNVLFQVYSRMEINTFEYDYLLTNHYIKFLNAVSSLGEQAKETIRFTSNGNWRICSKMLKRLSHDIDSNTRWFKTQGWGNTNFSCYSNNIYKWVIEIDGKTTFSQEFRMYNGKMNKIGPKVNDMKLFASKSSGALEKDRDTYKATFDGSTLEYIYFKFLINTPGEDMNVQVFIKVTYMEDETIFRDISVLLIVPVLCVWERDWQAQFFLRPVPVFP